ncbi:MAG TPA: serine hydrolase [Vicinamibacterales bacterium]|nr:serine hydrolase [Vicinamibacterales bacterium]
MTEQIAAVVHGFRGRMGVAALDLRTGETVAVNADERFPTASTIKTAVMIEAWQRVADGRLAMDTVVPLKETDKAGGSGVLRGMHDGLGVTIADLIHLVIVLSDEIRAGDLCARNRGHALDGGQRCAGDRRADLADGVRSLLAAALKSRA